MFKSRDIIIDYIKVLLAVGVVLITLLVRMPSAFLISLSDEVEDAYTDDSGLPYFTDPDSYYHIRLVNTMLKTGAISDTVSPDGEPWDMHSFYPEGRSGAYEPGIVRLTIALWKVFNLSAPIDISRVEFYMSGFMAMLTAVAAFVLGCRISGKIGGSVTGILIGCAPDFVARTMFGRFDTDIFVVLMNVLLILFLTEMLRVKEYRKQLAFAVIYIIISILYAVCWATRFSMLFVGLTLTCGLIFVVTDSLQNSRGLGAKSRISAFLKRSEVIILVGTGVLILFLVGLIRGFATVGDVFGSLTFSMSQEVKDGAMPNMFESISELTRPELVPGVFRDWFRGYVLGTPPTVITGIGGAFAAFAAIGGLVLLFLRTSVKTEDRWSEFPQKRESLMYLFVLGLWTVTGLYLIRSGIRFIEILAVPTGVLAGIFAEWISDRLKSDSLKWRIGRLIISIIIVTAIILPDFEGVFLSLRLPSVTDASANAMRWIKENAEDPDAVIASWWDMGYFYEAESDHPCLWDGGSQDPIRGILISRAMVEEDMETSYRILYMLACSGNAAVDLMMKHTDPKTAFDTLWEVLPMSSPKACSVIAGRCGVNAQTALEIDKLIHPREIKEIYLVIPYMMIQQTDMFEYLSDWDFTGTQVPYSEETLSYDEQEKIEAIREDYTMWRLFFDVEENPYFNCVFEGYDGVDGIRVWRVAPI